MIVDIKTGEQLDRMVQALTDLQTENARLRTALKVIRDMLNSPDPRRHRDITPELIYRTAVKALGGGE